MHTARTLQGRTIGIVLMKEGIECTFRLGVCDNVFLEYGNQRRKKKKKTDTLRARKSNLEQLVIV